MPSFYDRYKIKRNDDIGAPDYWNRRLKDIDARIAANEDVRADLDAVIEEGRTVFRDKADTVLLPLIQEVYDLANIGTMLRATSATEHTVSTGGKTFTITEGERLRFAAPAYVAIYRIDNPQAAMLGETVSYDSGTGELVVDIDRVSGAGTYGGWTITVASPSDTAEAISQVLAAVQDAVDAKDSAQNSENAAVDAKDSAVTKAQEANASSGSASDSADLAQQSVTTIQSVFATQSQVYLGGHEADPVTDLNGDSLVDGAQYWNTTDGQIKTYDGGGWTVSVVPIGSEVTSIYGRTGNVTAQAGDYSADKISISAITGITATQAQDALAELKTGIDGKAATAHSHAIADVTGLQAALDGKSDSGHSHAFADLTGRPVTIAGYGITDAYTTTEVDSALALKATITYVDDQISALLGGAPASALDTIAELAAALTDNDSDIAAITTTLAGKAALVHSHAIADVTGLQAAIDGLQSGIDGKAASAHSHAISDVTNLQTSLDAKLNASAYTANDVLAKIKTVDGAASGLDAELLGGVNKSSYLRKDEDGVLASGYTGTAADNGTYTTGNLYANPGGGNLRRVINGGAFNLRAPTTAGDYTVVVLVTNNASAGTITLLGFDKVAGDDLTTVNGDSFMLFITKINGIIRCDIGANQ